MTTPTIINMMVVWFIPVLWAAGCEPALTSMPPLSLGLAEAWNEKAPQAVNNNTAIAMIELIVII